MSAVHKCSPFSYVPISSHRILQGDIQRDLLFPDILLSRDVLPYVDFEHMKAPQFFTYVQYKFYFFPQNVSVLTNLFVFIILPYSIYYNIIRLFLKNSVALGYILSCIIFDVVHLNPSIRLSVCFLKKKKKSQST